jgi:hypothetical protein
MAFIKGVLKEELENSLKMKVNYERELAKLPKGSLVKSKRKGHEYYYLVFRHEGKVKLEYKGKVSKGEIDRYKQVKGKRAHYRKSLSKLKRQIKYLRGVLRGKESI